MSFPNTYKIPPNQTPEIPQKFLFFSKIADIPQTDV